MAAEKENNGLNFSYKISSKSPANDSLVKNTIFILDIFIKLILKLTLLCFYVYI